MPMQTQIHPLSSIDDGSCHLGQAIPIKHRRRFAQVLHECSNRLIEFLVLVLDRIQSVLSIIHYLTEHICQLILRFC